MCSITQASVAGIASYFYKCMFLCWLFERVGCWKTEIKNIQQKKTHSCGKRGESAFQTPLSHQWCAPVGCFLLLLLLLHSSYFKHDLIFLKLNIYHRFNYKLLIIFSFVVWWWNNFQVIQCLLTHIKKQPPTSRFYCFVRVFYQDRPKLVVTVQCETLGKMWECYRSSHRCPVKQKLWKNFHDLDRSIAISVKHESVFTCT